MAIKRNGSQPSGKGPAEWFTGNVWIDPLFQPTGSTRRMSPVSRSSLGPDSLAQSPTGPALDRDGWLRAGTELGRLGRKDSPR